MKTRIFLLCMALSATAWGAEPAASNMAAPADTSTTTTPTNTNQPPAATTAPATPSAAAKTSDTAQQTAPFSADKTQQKSANAEVESGFSRGSVVRSVFTTGVKNREPINKLNNGKTDDNHIFYFTELRDMSGQTAVHRWSYNGKVVAQVKFNVRGPRWRVWSSKTIPVDDTGEWKVFVLNGAGQVIAEDMIDYTGQPVSQTPPVANDDSAPASQQPAAAQPPASNQSTPASTNTSNTPTDGNGSM